MDPEPWEAALKLWLQSEYDQKEGGGLDLAAFRRRLLDFARLLDAVDRVGDFAALPAGATVLDGGTGSGLFLLGLLERRPLLHGVGVDLSPAAVEGARARAAALGFPGARFDAAHLEALPFPSQAFDAALSACTLNLLPRRADGLREIARVLKPGAPFVLLESLRVGAPFLPGGHADPVAFRREAAASGLVVEGEEDVTGEVRRLCGLGAWPWSGAVRDESRFLVMRLRRTG